jgi:hypothetical protein
VFPYCLFLNVCRIAPIKISLVLNGVISGLFLGKNIEGGCKQQADNIWI